MIIKKRLFAIITLLILVITSGLIVSAISSISNNEETNEYEIKTEEFFIDSALFTHKDDLTVYNQEVVDMTNFELKLDNANLSLYSNKRTGAIRILNKSTGYYWCSDVYNLNEDDLIAATLKKLTSSFYLVYRDQDGKVKDIYTRDSEVKLTEKVSGNTLSVTIYLSKSEIGFTYDITLLDNSINLKLKNDSIKEDGTNKIASLRFFPYLGNAYQDSIPGYVFIPAGSGALVRYSKTSPITQEFTAPFYGVDANISKNSETDILSLPVYGVVHGIKQNAMFTEIKSGSTFATLTYNPSSSDQDYNLIYPTFNYRETYLLQIPGSDQILMVPSDYYKNDIEIEYTFLGGNDASYVGMAKAYQDSLVNAGVITESNDSKENISLQLETFGRDYERGLIFKRYKNMTTTKDILEMNAFLIDNGIDDIFYVLRAFNKGGYSNQSASNYKFDGALGSIKDLKDLEAYYYYNPIESYNSKKSFPNKTLVNLYNEKNYILVEKEKYKFYSQVPVVEKYVNKAFTYYEDKAFDGLAFDGIGYRLYGDKNNSLTRTDAMDVITNLLSSKKVLMYTPNSYLFGSTSKYLNMPLYSSRYRFVTDSVPFLELVLKGYIDYYSPYLNFSSNIDLDILKCIEFGVSPAFLVTTKESYNLSNTLSSNYYATYFESVKSVIAKDYNYINQALREVIGAKITDREILEEGISVVTYSNGKKIIVNYTNDSYTFEGAEVKPLSYKVK